MTHTARANTISGNYDEDNEVAYSGDPLLFSENLGLAEAKYYGTAWTLINVLKGGQSLPRPSKPWSSSSSPAYTENAVHLGNGFWDTTGGEEWNPIATGESLDPYLPQGTWILRWVGTCTCRWSAEDYSWASETGSQTNTLIAGQTHSNFDNVSPNGTFSGGTGHAVDDIITLVSGAAVTVDAVSSGVVTQFTIDKGNGTLRPAAGDDGTQLVSTADNQSSTTGSGTGFSLTPEYPNILHRRTYLTTTTSQAGGTTVRTANGTCTRLELLQPGNEARFDAGNIVASQTVSDLSGFVNLRFMGVLQTNNSPFRLFSEYQHFDDAVWMDAMPAKAIALFCNECNADPWVCVPHMFDTTEASSFFQEIYDNLDSGLSIWVEYTNEVTYNAAPAFKEQFSWNARGDINPVVGTITLSTASVSATSHGFSNGEEIVIYANYEHLSESFAPYNARGQNFFVIVDDANTYRLANTAAAVTRDADVTDTLDADYSTNTDTNTKTALARMTIIVAKSDEDSTKTSDENYAITSAAMWDAADTIFGRSRVKHIAMGQRTNASHVAAYVTDANFRSKVDYIGCSCYTRFLDLGGAQVSMPELTHIVNGQTEANFDNTDKVTDAQDETDYDEDPEVEGRIEAGGSGYAATDTITLSDSTVITIDAVSSGAVTQFTVDASSSTTGATVNNILTQSSTSGSGTGFQLRTREWNITWNGTFDGGTGHAVSDVIRLGRVFTADTTNNRLDGIQPYVPYQQMIRFETTGTLPDPLQPDTDYWVLTGNTPENWITLSSEGPFGTQLEINDTGTGQHRLKGYVDVTVDAVSSGVVTEFTISSTNDGGRHKPDVEFVQISTTGSGTGFSITPGESNINSVATLTDCYNFLVNNMEPQVLGQQQNSINAAKRDIQLNYEGFDHNGSAVWSYKTPSIGQLVELYGRSTERTNFVSRWCRLLANKHVYMTSHHSFVTDYDHSGVWGMMEHQGDTDAAEYTALLPYFTAGSASKIKP